MAPLKPAAMTATSPNGWDSAPAGAFQANPHVRGALPGWLRSRV